MSKLKSIVQTKWVFGFASLIFVALDQISKEFAKEHLRLKGPINILGDFFIFQYAENRGAFLSLGATLSESARFFIFSVLVFFFLAYLSYLLYFKNQPKWNAWAIVFVLSGGIGNLIDRVSRGKVVDFMNLGIGSLRTGIFNVADFIIVIGVTMLIVSPKPKVQSSN